MNTRAELCNEYQLDGRLVEKLLRVLEAVERETGLTWTVISGFRSAAEQSELQRQGRPTAPEGCSTHRVCPATGADVRVASFPTRTMRATFGRIATEHGLRWGGGSPVDDAGIPIDWNHVDLGPIC